MGQDNGRVGRYGEELAARYLQEHGFVLISRNYRVGRLGELDLVALAEDGCSLCFVEVKTRTGDTHGSPAEAVTRDKQRRIRRMAQVFLQERSAMENGNGRDRPVRFDVVEVLLDREQRTARVHHIPQAF